MSSFGTARGALGASRRTGRFTDNFESVHARSSQRDGKKKRGNKASAFFGKNCKMSKETQRLVMRMSKSAGLSDAQLRTLGQMAPQRHGKAFEAAEGFSNGAGSRGTGARGSQNRPPQRAAVKNVPKVGTAKSRYQHRKGGGGGGGRPGPGTHRPARRTAAAIAQAQEARRADVRRFRPAPKKALSTDTEKRRLQAQFQYKGGNALPKAASHGAIQGHVPMHLITGHDPTKRGMAAQRASRAQAKRNREKCAGPRGGAGRVGAAAAGGNNKGDDGMMERMFDDTFREIEERRDRLGALDAAVKARAASGGGTRGYTTKEQLLARTLENEIRTKLHDLEKIDGLMKRDD